MDVSAGGDTNAGTGAVPGRTIAELFARRVEATPHAVAYLQFDADAGGASTAGEWRRYRWRDVRELAQRRQAWLETLALGAGERVALMMPNGIEWVAFDVAAAGLGLVTVPLYAYDQPGNLGYILEQTRARLLLIHSDEQWQLARPAVAAMREPPRTVSVEALADDDVETLGELLRQSPRRDYATGDADAADVATIVYTSGTTGRPKGVTLSHRNVLSNAEAAGGAVPIGGGDLLLSFLPLSHMFERTVGYYVPMMFGAGVAYARSVAGLTEDLAELSPTCLISVPRVYERIHARLNETVARQSRWRRRLFAAALAVGWRRFLWRQGRGWHPALLSWPLLCPIARRFQKSLGGRLRYLICGGAPLSVRVSRVFLSLGMNLLQGYGTTETSPVVAVNRARHNRPDSVGPPLDNVGIRIGERDELLVRGAGVMQGYWRDRDASRRAVDARGWLHTGDVARIEDGYLYITGRLKDIIVLSTGEKIAPADVEAEIMLDPLFEQALVVGEGRPYLAVIAVPDAEQWRSAAPQPGAYASAAARAFALARVRARLSSFPAYAEIKKIALIAQRWSMENGLLTPTLKPKRNAIMARYQALVDELYAGH